MHQLADQGDLLTIEELAQFFGISKDTAYRWNVAGTGPRRIQIGRRVMYRKADVQDWIDGQAAK